MTTCRRACVLSCISALVLAILVFCACLGVCSTDSERPLARYEPPDGMVYHGASSNPTVVGSYLAALDEDVEPLIEGIHLGVAGTSGRQYIVDTIREWLEHVQDAGRIPHLSLSMTDGHGNPADVEIATTSQYDATLDEIAAVIAAYDAPLFVRFGFEFNGSWNGYTPGVYPMAYHKMVDRFRDAGVTKAAYIWCYEPDAPDNFDGLLDGRLEWYPGDEYVDWFGLDLFGVEHFVPATSARERANSAYERSIRFLEMASEHGKPVMLSETAAVKIYVTEDAEDPDLVDGRTDWETWFQPFFDFIAQFPQIKGFLYMSQDYRGTYWERENGWGDARIQPNSYIHEHYLEALREERFLHRDDGLYGT